MLCLNTNDPVGPRFPAAACDKETDHTALFSPRGNGYE
jgi:hypothetical protein